jgi:FMN phosphatase YigB (HAD superfamily)
MNPFWSIPAPVGTLTQHVTKLRAILFDFGGTLDLTSHWLDRFLECYRDAGLELQREQLDKAFSHATRLGYAAGPSVEGLGLAGLVEFLIGKQLEYREAAGPPDTGATLKRAGSVEGAKLAARIAAGFVGRTSEGLKRNRRVLEELRPHFKLGVVSNFYGNLESVLKEAGMAELIDAAMDSTRVGIFKPDPRIFELALAKLEVAANEAAMVGDSLLKDCVPAQRLGMRTILIDAARHGPKDVGIPDVPDYVIGSLEEILAIKW